MTMDDGTIIKVFGVDDVTQHKRGADSSSSRRRR